MRLTVSLAEAKLNRRDLKRPQKQSSLCQKVVQGEWLKVRAGRTRTAGLKAQILQMKSLDSDKPELSGQQCLAQMARTTFSLTIFYPSIF